MKIAESITQTAYGKPADRYSPVNQNEDFQQGFAIGFALDPCNMAARRDAISWEFDARGRPDERGAERESWREWNRGLWSGVWTAIDETVDTATIDFNDLET